jgi:ferredoxin-type protein NapH
METQITLKKLLVPCIFLLAFWGLALWGYLSSGFIQPLIIFGYIGSALGIGLGLYAILPKKQKSTGRRLTLFLVGLFLVGFAIFMGRENIQIEGAIFGLLTGVIQMAVIHYLIAKVFGPLLFGRLWCGWACWTAMVLDLLPFKRSPGRLPGRWGWIRYAFFGLILVLCLVLVYGFGFRDGAAGSTAVAWFIISNFLYYVVAISLAYWQKDNRAFCKYICPVVVPLKITSRFSLLKIGQGNGVCNDCNACDALCPLDIRVSDYILDKKRVLSTECTLCQTCTTACHRDALKLSFGFDLGGREMLHEKTLTS